MADSITSWRRASTSTAGAQSLAGYDDVDTLDGQNQGLEEVAELVRSLRKRITIKRKGQGKS